MKSWHSIEREARYRLNWTTNQVWGVVVPYENNTWKVRIYTPRKTLWAKAVAWNKKSDQAMTHVIKNQKFATHKPTGQEFIKTTWLCGNTTYTKPEINKNPTVGCAKCQAKLVGMAKGEVRLK